ncbi:hypothetical protein HMSSN036_14170 [Paenibacillus macerans]|nr:hypothetical protein HMSSN036_14170 [Paenibacillus macerans]
MDASRRFSVVSGTAFMDRLLSLPQRPTAIFCLNDLVAIGALKAAAKAGLKVPGDISIVGYDDIPFASNSIPELTTVSLRANELGRTAAEILHKMITKDKVAKTTLLKPELVVRESTSAPAE